MTPFHEILRLYICIRLAALMKEDDSEWRDLTVHQRFAASFPQSISTELV